MEGNPDGTRILYTLTPGSFPSTSRDTQIHLAHVDGSVDRPMTHTAGAQNQGALWRPSGDFFAFASNRDGAGRQLYLMWPDGGSPGG